MQYECGHDGCDICGQRRCEPYADQFEQFKALTYTITACKGCVRRGVKLALEMAQQFGGTIIDPARPCARPRQQVPPRPVIEEANANQQ